MRRQACAGAIVFDDAGRLLLVRRGHAPSLGLWCEPSGRCEPGEPALAAAVRECREETGLIVRPVRRAGAVSLADDGTTYDLEDFVCEVVGGELTPGDDAAEVRWVTATDLAALDLAPGVRDSLTRWGCLPR
ncbi:MAG: NUDIX domain-containing protein [Jatrophihabitans sp.]|nr:MAG: NUDIX domain-containing protein [Jatrophihabitans sp.]